MKYGMESQNGQKKEPLKKQSPFGEAIGEWKNIFAQHKEKDVQAFQEAKKEWREKIAEKKRRAAPPQAEFESN